MLVFGTQGMPASLLKEFFEKRHNPATLPRSSRAMAKAKSLVDPLDPTTAVNRYAKPKDRFPNKPAAPAAKENPVARPFDLEGIAAARTAIFA